MPDPADEGLEANDVVLSDGSTALLRSVTPEDAPLVSALHERLSPETIRLRYFGAHPHLSESELAHLVERGGPDRFVLVAERGGQLMGMAQYDRITGSDVAEVAFVVDDAHQELGIGTLLLEYLASHGRREGLKRFAADTLLENDLMMKVFRDAGYTRRSTLDAGVIRVIMDIAPTPEALEALYERDRIAAAKSMQRLLRPRSVAVIGASRKAGHGRPRAGAQPGHQRFPRAGVPCQPDAPPMSPASRASASVEAHPR